MQTRINQDKINEIYRKCNSFLQMKKQISEMFEVSYKKLRKGVNLSAQLSASSLSSREVEVQKPISLQQKTNLQDRNTRIIMYETIKNLVLRKLGEETEAETDQSTNYTDLIPYKIFQQFTPE